MFYVAVDVMTKIIELKDKEVLVEKVEQAKKIIYQHLVNNMGDEETQIYLFSLGLESKVKRGELPPHYLDKKFNSKDDIDDELLSFDTPLTEVGYNEMVNSLAIILYGDQLFGTFYYNNERFGESIDYIMEDISQFDEFKVGTDTIETIDVAVLLSDNTIGLDGTANIKVELI